MLTDFFVSNYLTLVILFFLAVIVYVNRKMNIPAARLVTAIIIVLLFVEILDYGEDVLSGEATYKIDISDIEFRIKLRTVMTTLLYVLRPTIILLELLVICPNKKYWLPLAVPTVVNACIYMPTMFGRPLAFEINGINAWIPLYPFNLTIYIVQLLYVLILLLATIQSFRGKNRTASLILLSIFTVSVITAIFEYTSVHIGSINTVTALCVLVYYVYLSTMYQHEMRKTITQKELEIAQNELTILKNQMHPHFIYNSLATIRLLAKRDSKKAVKSIDDFSKYLKSHIGAIQNEDLIPFMEELENVKVYLTMVQESYRSRIELIYKLDVTEFKLPPLSLEPIVENAVNHGIGRLSGTITISTFTENKHIIIRVKDSGSKETASEEYKPFHNGIGLENTAKRLKIQCGGELKTDFSGNGGVVDVILPIGEEEIK